MILNENTKLYNFLASTQLFWLFLHPMSFEKFKFQNFFELKPWGKAPRV
jgi:hypothetical protein